MKSKFTLIAITGIVLLAGAATAYVLRDTIIPLGSTATSDVKNNGKPTFVFDNKKLPGLWTSGNTRPDPGDADSNTPPDATWPIASISVHQCAVTTKCSNPEKDTIGGHCFVMAFYQKGSIDQEAARAKMMADNKKWGMAVQEVATTTLSIDTPEGAKEYVLHHYDYNSKGDATKRGNAQGYVPLSDGYIDIRSVCNEANQLNETLPVLLVLRLAA